MGTFRYQPDAPPLTVGIDFARGLLSGLRAQGVDCDDWLREAGIEPQALANEHERVTLRQYAGLLHLLVERRDDEALGLLTRPARRGFFALQVRSALGALDLEAAIRRIAHVFRLVVDDVQLVPMRDGALAGVALEFHHPAVASNPMVHELLLRVYWRVFSCLIGGQLAAARFDFAFPRPPYSDGYGPIFPAPWRFDAERSALWFAADRLRMPVCRDEAAVRAFVADGPINVILPRRDMGLSARVRLHLERTQPLWPDLVRTAQALNVSASTLQRRLAAEGTSFQGLKDSLRREIAIFRLHTSEVPAVKLATQLGFADTAAFQPAFKHWTGASPGTFRRKPG